MVKPEVKLSIKEKTQTAKKDIVKIREEMALLEAEKIETPLFSEERAKEIAPYMAKEVPALFSVVYRESEKNYLEISNIILNNIEKVDNGELTRDQATEVVGKMLFEKCVRPSIAEENEKKNKK